MVFFEDNQKQRVTRTKKVPITNESFIFTLKFLFFNIYSKNNLKYIFYNLLVLHDIDIKTE